MFPWIIFAVIAIPFVLIGFAATRRRTTAAEFPAGEDARARARTEREFAEAEAYEAKWREEREADKDTYRERFP